MYCNVLFYMKMSLPSGVSKWYETTTGWKVYILPQTITSNHVSTYALTVRNIFDLAFCSVAIIAPLSLVCEVWGILSGKGTIYAEPWTDPHSTTLSILEGYFCSGVETVKNPTNVYPSSIKYRRCFRQQLRRQWQFLSAKLSFYQCKPELVLWKTEYRHFHDSSTPQIGLWISPCVPSSLLKIKYPWFVLCSRASAL